MFTLGRKIDIHYSTNIAIGITSILAAAIGYLITGEVLPGLFIGGGTFLTWALAREVDPKHDYSAFLCVFFSLLNLFYYENIQLLPIFWMILTMRLVNGISGKELTFLDIFSVLGMTIYLSISNENSIYIVPFILAMAFLVKFKERIGLALTAGGIALVTFIVESFFMDYLLFNIKAYSQRINILVLAMALISFIFWSFLSRGEIRDDLGNIARRGKIISSQITYSITILLVYFFGDIGINNLIIYLSVMGGVIVYWLGYKTLTEISKN